MRGPGLRHRVKVETAMISNTPQRMTRRRLTTCCMPDRNLCRRRPRGCEVSSPLCHALEEFVTLAQAADTDVFVLQHGFDNPENRFRAQVVAVIKAFNVRVNFVLAQAGIFERALLEA